MEMELPPELREEPALWHCALQASDLQNSQVTDGWGFSSCGVWRLMGAAVGSEYGA